MMQNQPFSGFPESAENFGVANQEEIQISGYQQQMMLNDFMMSQSPFHVNDFQGDEGVIPDNQFDVPSQSFGYPHNSNSYGDFETMQIEAAIKDENAMVNNFMAPPFYPNYFY